MHAAVAFEAVSYTAGGRAILSRLSFEIAAGETLVLLGRSGSGKTTALRMVNAMLYPGDGCVRVDGRPTTEWDPVRLRRRTGYVIQEVGLFPHYTIEQNVGLVPRLEGWQPDRIAKGVEELLDRVGLPPADFLRRYPHELSGGQRQRVAIARALAADPPLLLFDEPFGSLDPITRHESRQHFLRLRRELAKTALFVTHDVGEALALGTRIALLSGGGLAFLGTPAEFLASANDEVRLFRACLE
ncbi:MAG: ATP-binding cassette domain-containing protein [Bryobacteraceae bacterium]